MIQRVALISGLLISASCTVLHQLSIPSHILRVPQEEVNYNFAYDVNDMNTGDIKSQSETRRGDVVLGQYSLLQPDGVRRTVEYRADDNTGFIATVNNNGRPVEQSRDQPDITSAAPRAEEQINQITNQVRIPVTVPTTPTIARSVILQSRHNTHEPWISTILHV